MDGTSTTIVPTVPEPEGGIVKVVVTEPVQVEVKVAKSVKVDGTSTTTVPIVSEPDGEIVKVVVEEPVQVDVKVV